MWGEKWGKASTEGPRKDIAYQLVLVCLFLYRVGSFPHNSK